MEVHFSRSFLVSVRRKSCSLSTQGLQKSTQKLWKDRSEDGLIDAKFCTLGGRINRCEVLYIKRKNLIEAKFCTHTPSPPAPRFISKKGVNFVQGVSDFRAAIGSSSRWQMVDDDDDYMADLSRFLPTEATALVTQGRNGKLSLGAKSNPPAKEKKKVVQGQSKKVEEEQRKEGLGSAIPSSNIGFKMLQQMGYTAGTALGKHGQGLLEPVNIDLKRSRTGLGRDRAAEEEKLVKARRAEVEAMRNTQKEKALRADFQERTRDSWRSRKIAIDYEKACGTYLQLEARSQSSASATQETKDNIPPRQKTASFTDGVSTAGEADDKPEEEEEEEEITLEMLQAVLQKLRDQYSYCLYCGYKYESAAALAANCPGLDEDTH